MRDEEVIASMFNSLISLIHNTHYSSLISSQLFITDLQPVVGPLERRPAAAPNRAHASRHVRCA